MSAPDGTAAALFAIRLCLAALFLSAAVGKLAHAREFVHGTIDYQILPVGAARVVGRVLPWVELAVGIALLLGLALPVTGLVTAALLAAFIAAVAINLTRGRSIDCNCYGIAATSTTSWGTVARNGLLLAMALAVSGLGSSGLHGAWLTPWTADGLVPASAAQAIVVALLAAWCLVVVHLVEWTVDIHLRVSDLRTNELGSEGR